MKHSNGITRIRLSELRSFKTQYLLPSRPVIIENLYKNDEISSINTVQRAEKRFGNARLRLNKNYYGKFIEKQPQIECSLSQYLEWIRQGAALDLMCTENPTHAEVLSTFRIPVWARGATFAPALSWMHMGHQGAFAPLHFDWDLRHVLLTQIFGKKRVILISPHYSKYLNPCENFSGIALHQFSAKMRSKFLRYHDGYECILNPGETLYMPMLWWHAVSYSEVGMSFNVRFTYNPYGYVLSALPPNHLLQNIAIALLDEENNSCRYPDDFDAIMKAYYSASLKPYARYTRMMSLYRDIYVRICSSAFKGEYFSSFFDVEEWVRRTDKEAIGGKYNPKFLTTRDWRMPKKVAPVVKKLMMVLYAEYRRQADAHLKEVMIRNCSWLF